MTPHGRVGMSEGRPKVGRRVDLIVNYIARFAAGPIDDLDLQLLFSRGD
jgi:hypothetical protein